MQLVFDVAVPQAYSLQPQTFHIFLRALRGEYGRSLFLKESSMGIGILALLVVAVVVIVWVVSR